jgi:PIN domain nuclease of toxin-antitoxin system
MNYLIDTNILLWYFENNENLKDEIMSIIDDENNLIFISMATLWEIATKFSLGKLKLESNLDKIIDIINSTYGFSILSITEKHILFYSTLPFHHRDPFDRLIFAQSVVEGFELLYTDKIFDKYKITT